MHYQDELDRIPGPYMTDEQCRRYWEYNRRPFETVVDFRARMDAATDPIMRDFFAGLLGSERNS